MAIIGVYLVLLLIAPTAWSSNTVTYHGLVLDAETFEPIEGALVKSEWLYASLYTNSIESRWGNEAVSNKEGRWSLKGPHSYRVVPGYYSPRSIHEKLMEFLWMTGLVEDMPNFLVQKEGYSKYSIEIYPAEFKDHKGFVIRGGHSFYGEIYKQTYKQKYPDEFSLIGV